MIENKELKRKLKELVQRWKNTYNRPGGSCCGTEAVNAAKHQAACDCANELEDIASGL